VGLRRVMAAFMLSVGCSCCPTWPGFSVHHGSIGVANTSVASHKHTRPPPNYTAVCCPVSLSGVRVEGRSRVVEG
jgi:hypothetical protein